MATRKVTIETDELFSDELDEVEEFIRDVRDVSDVEVETDGGTAEITITLEDQPSDDFDMQAFVWYDLKNTFGVDFYCVNDELMTST